MTQYITARCVCYGMGCPACGGSGWQTRVSPLTPVQYRPRYYDLGRVLRRLAATQRNLPLRMTEEEHAALLEAAKLLEAL